MDFKNKVALVTGGSSGIGRATAIAFAKEGAKVVVAARREAAGQKTVQQIKDMGGTAIFIPTDVTKSDEIETLIQKTIDTYGQLDCAFNNAGTEGLFAPITELTEANWDLTITWTLGKK